MNPQFPLDDASPSLPLSLQTSLGTPENWANDVWQYSKASPFSGVGEAVLGDTLTPSESLLLTDWPIDLQTQSSDLELAVAPLQRDIGTDPLTGQASFTALTYPSSSLAAAASDSLSVVTDSSGIRDIKDQATKLWSVEGAWGWTQHL